MGYSGGQRMQVLQFTGLNIFQLKKKEITTAYVFLFAIETLFLVVDIFIQALV